MGRIKERMKEYFVKYAAEIASGMALMNGDFYSYRLYHLLKRDI